LKLSYYPGCSLHSTGVEFDLSVKSVSSLLGIELTELEDWNCCGASSAHSLNHELSIDLPLRNLEIAEKQGNDLVIACAACFSTTKMAEYESLDEKKREKYNHKFTHKIKVKHFIDTIVDDIGLPQLKEKVQKKLENLKVASYYGCLLVRPPKVNKFDKDENPVKLDLIMKAIGATPIKWSGKTDCCGGNLSLTRSEIVTKLVSDIVNMAKKGGANCIATACPLCQANLEIRQTPSNPPLIKGEDKSGGLLPVFYFTELVAIALGAKDYKNWMKKHLIDPFSLIGEW
jgi:heterodisulfide reductase subunit B2